MAINDIIKSEFKQFTCPISGNKITQLTDYLCHSYHFYFTNEDLWDNKKQMLIASHRNNSHNLYSVNLDTGETRQLTDFPSGAKPNFQCAEVSLTRNECYFSLDNKLIIALDLDTCEQRTLYKIPQGYNAGMLNITADGKFICLETAQDLSDKIRMNTANGYIGFREYSAARPHCQIIAIDVDDASSRVIYEENFWLGHVNTSPTLADKLTFCHEGPWVDIEQRMWLLDINTGKANPLRQQVPDEALGHEYWFADGKHIGYHGRIGKGKREETNHIFGWISYDNTNVKEYDFPFISNHFHSIDEKLIVGDCTAGGDIVIWKLNDDDTYADPRILANHRGSFHTQILHPHPRMFYNADGQLQVVFTADPDGYGNVYITDVPDDLNSLPLAEK